MLSWTYAGRTVAGRNSRPDLMCDAGPGWMRYPAEAPTLCRAGILPGRPTNLLAYRGTIPYVSWYAAKTTWCHDAFADH